MRGSLCLGLATILATAVLPGPVNAQEPGWTQIFGGSQFTIGSAIAADDTGAYVGGRIMVEWGGGLPGEPAAGLQDALIRKVSPSGAVLWTHQFGTPGWDGIYAAATAPGGVVVAGSVEGALPGQVQIGSGDAFVRRYDSDGNEIWTRQFGSAGYDQAEGVAVDATGVYVAGTTTGALPGVTSVGGNDAFLVKFSLDGDLLWTRQFGSTGTDAGHGVSAGPDGAYVVGGLGSGSTSADLSQHAFIRHFSPEGSEMWATTFGVGDAVAANGIAWSQAGIYVSGRSDVWVTGGPYLTTQTRAFIAQFDETGTETWRQQLDQDGSWAWAVAVDDLGAYITGSTDFGSIYGDAFVRAYAADGTLQWSSEFGTDGSTQHGRGIATVPGALYVAGWWQNNLAFVAQFPVAEPDSTPPQLTLPSDITTDALSPAGVPVEYEASALDDRDGPVPVACTPGPGSTFPLGATEVNCAATDAAGNLGAGVFTVIVKDANWQLVDVRSAIAAYGQSGSSLDDKIVTVMRLNTAAKIRQACDNLLAFDKSVQAQVGRSLTSDEAFDLITRSGRIRNVIGCPSR